MSVTRTCRTFAAACMAWIVSGLFALYPMFVHASASCGRMPVKPLHTAMAGDDLGVNGIDSSVRVLTLAGPSGDIVNAFRAYWAEAGVPARGQQVGNAWILSALDASCYYVLQVPRTGKGSRIKGLFAVTRLREDVKPADTGRTSVLPDGATHLSAVRSRDPMQVGDTWVLSVPGDARGNVERYQARLARAGWRPLAAAPAYGKADGRSPAPVAKGHVVMMQRGGDRLDAVFFDAGASADAVINIARSR